MAAEEGIPAPSRSPSDPEASWPKTSCMWLLLSASCGKSAEDHVPAPSRSASVEEALGPRYVESEVCYSTYCWPRTMSWQLQDHHRVRRLLGPIHDSMDICLIAHCLRTMSRRHRDHRLPRRLLGPCQFLTHSFYYVSYILDRYR